MGRESKLNPFAKEHGLERHIVVRDRLGRQLKPGDQIIIDKFGSGLIWEIDAVTPMVDPRQPANMAIIRLKTMYGMRGPRDTAWLEVMRIASSDETRPIDEPAVEQPIHDQTES